MNWGVLEQGAGENIWT